MRAGVREQEQDPVVRLEGFSVESPLIDVMQNYRGASDNAGRHRDQQPKLDLTDLRGDFAQRPDDGEESKKHPDTADLGKREIQFCRIGMAHPHEVLRKAEKIHWRG